MTSSTRDVHRLTHESEVRELLGGELLEPCAVQGKVPRLGLLVTVEQAYTHCAKAIIRSDLWNPELHVDRSQLPSSGEILRSLSCPEFDAGDYDRERAGRYARGEGLY